MEWELLKPEVWKDIPDYEGLYQVSNLGNVRSLNYKRTNEIRVLKLCTHKSGYKYTHLCKDKVSKNYRIHRLVAEAFLPNPNNLPQVNHKDENKQNNCVDNLEWCTAEYNTNYGTRNERVRGKMSGDNNCKTMLGKFGKEHHRSKIVYQYTKDGKFIKRWECARDVMRELGFNNKNISSCALGKRNLAYGYIWKYAV